MVITPGTIKILGVMWNMLIKSENVLDDFVIFDKHNKISSIPVKKGNKSDAKANKTATKVKAVDGKEKEKAK
jgi:hypothetical protein